MNNRQEVKDAKEIEKVLKSEGENRWVLIRYEQ